MRSAALTHPWCRGRLALALALYLTACVPDLSVDDDAQIGCQDDGDCPDGFVCKPSLGRCLKAAGQDDVPPRVSQVSIDPPHANDQTSVSVAFTVDEELLEDPAVVLDTPQRHALSLASREGLRFTYAYTPNRTEPQEAVSVVASLIDRSGNQALDLPLGEINFDFEAPRIEGFQVVGEARLNAGRVGQVEFTVVEASPDTIAAVLTDGTALVRSDAVNPPTYRFHYTPDGTEDEGPLSVVLNARDLAGNAADPQTHEAFRLDFTAPTVLSSPGPSVSPAVAQLGQLIEARFTVSEPLGAVPAVELLLPGGSASKAMRLATRSGNEYVFDYPVAGSDAEGSYQVALTSFVDEAGNAGEAGELGEVVIDLTEPEITGFTVTPEQLSDVEGHNLLSVTFKVSEPLGASGPSVRLGDTRITGCVRDPGPPIGYECTHRIEQLNTPEGIATVTVEVQDPAGYRAFDGKTVLLDYTGPTLAADDLSPALARAGNTVVYTFTPDEPLGAVPTLTVSNGSHALPFAHRTGSTYVFDCTVVGDEPEGAYTARVDLVDAVGNQTLGAAAKTLTLDSTPPAISGLTVTPDRISRFPGYNQVTIDFAVDEDVGVSAPGLSVRVGDVPVTDCVQIGIGPYGYQCTYAARNEDVHGATEVSVKAADAAGNAGFASARLFLDFEGPGLIAAEASPPVARAGSTLVYTVTPDEALLEEPDVTVSGPADLTLAYRAGSAYAFDYVVTESDEDGTYTTSIAMTDAVGNPATVADDVGFRIDASIPAVSNLTVTPDRVSRLPEHDEVQIVFDVTEDVGADAPGLEVEVGGVPVTGCQQSGDPPAVHYDCAYTVRPQDTNGAWPVTVQAMDSAGNLDFASGSVRFDFDAPGLLGSSVNLPLAGVGDVLYYTVTPDEPLADVPDLTVGGAGTLTLVHQAGTEYTYRYQVGGSEADGEYTVRVALTDLAGNPASEDGVSFEIDAGIPVITPDTLLTDNPRDDGLAGNGHVVTATFTVSEALPADPLVTVGGLAMTRQGTGDAPYTYTRTAAPADGDGEKIVVVRVADAAGNSASAELGRVSFDFTPPAVVSGSESVQLFPSLANPLFQVTEITVGTRARVSFSANEILGADPIVRSTAGSPGPLILRHYLGAGTFFQYEMLGYGTEAQGTYALEAVLEDMAGNTGTSPLTLPAPGIVVDLDPPDPPDVDTPDRIVYTRVPWGAQYTGGVSEFTIHGEDGAIEASEGQRKRWVTAMSPLGGELGRVEVTETGSFDMLLVPTDWPVVALRAIDGAGNSSTWAQVRNVNWFATMGYKVRGSTMENPHRLLTTGMIEPTLVQPEGTALEVSQDDLYDVYTADGSALIRDAEHSWLKRADGTFPAGRATASMAYDSARGKIVLFGGFQTDGSQPLETWECDIRSGVWTDVTPDGAKPAARREAAMAYDASRGTVVLFGGDVIAWTNDTWEWDGAARTWTEVTPVGDKPVERFQHAMAYDPTRRKIVMFGGRGGPATGFDDTWEWDGEAHSWTDVTPTGDSPTGRVYHAMAWDPDRSKVLMHGGIDDWGHCVSPYSGLHCNDTWEWDGEARTWTRLEPPVLPASRAGHGMAYDRARHEMVVFGGLDGTWTDKRNDTIALSSADDTWTDLTPTTGSPSERAYSVMFYDERRQRPRLFGGYDEAFVALPELWEWDGDARAWTEVTPDGVHPAGRENGVMAYDPVAGQSVLFGGFVPAVDRSQETWIWNSATGLWTDVTPTGTKPPARTASAMAFDSFLGGMLLFSGSFFPQLADTWLWDSDTRTWADVTPGGTSPPAREYFGMAYDTHRHKAVIYGCWGLVDTWEWDSATSTWDNVTPAGDSPPERSYVPMVYDPDQHEVVLFGGNDTLHPGVWFGDTWVWDGEDRTWTEVTPASSPPARFSTRLVWDSARHKVLLFSGASVAVDDDDTWEWDGATRTWTEVTPPLDKPGTRYNHHWAYDDASQRAVVFSGVGQDDTWEWHSAVDTRAAALWEVSWSAASAGAAVPGQLVVSAVAGGRGNTTGATPEQEDGAALLVWNHRLAEWEILAFNDAPIDDPQALTSQPLDLEKIQDLLFGEDNKLNFAVAPVQTNGSAIELGAVSVDYLEAMISYTRP